MPLSIISSELLFGKFGHFFAITSFVSSCCAVVAYIIATQKSEQKSIATSWLLYGRRAFIIHTLSVVAVFGILFIIINLHLFQYKYVWQHSSKDLPFYYVFSALWAGQEGSTLLWMFWIALVGCVLIVKAKAYESGVMLFVALAQVMLGSMLLGIFILDYKVGSNPFVLLKEAMDIPIFKLNPNYVPEDGTGLNPSLQNYWMVIHPPTLFLGFALTTVPAGFAFASLWKREYTLFPNAVLPWTLLSLLVLGAGILMGGAWAYEALSFGGFWAWDPVENASLVPWLIMAAALHTLLIYKNSGHSLTSVYLFMLLSFLLVLYSSFLTKSGVLGDASVHSFTDMGMSGQLVVSILVFLLPSVILFGYRNYKKQIPSPDKEESSTSREFWLFIGALLFAIAALHIIVLTSFPVINKIPFIENKLAPPSNIKEHYNSVQLWMAFFVAVGAAVVQFLKYKQTPLNKFWKNFIIASILTIICSVSLISIYKLYRFDYILLLLASWFAVFANGQYILSVLKGNIRLSGGAITHLGFGLIIVGIVISQGKQEVVSLNRYGINYGSGFSNQENVENVLLYQYEPQEMGKYRVIYLGDSVSGKNIYFNVLYQQLNKQKKVIKEFILHPNILINSKMGNNPVPSTQKTITSDLYTHITMAPLKQDGSQPDSVVKDTYKLGIGDTIMNSNSFLIIENINPNAQVKGINLGKNDIAIGIQLRYQDLDTSYSLEPIYLIKEFLATSITATTHDKQSTIAVTKIIPQENKFEFIVEQKLNKYIIMKAIKFPLINLLWLGILVMLVGIYISMRKRISDNAIKYAN